LSRWDPGRVSSERAEETSSDFAIVESGLGESGALVNIEWGRRWIRGIGCGGREQRRTADVGSVAGGSHGYVWRTGGLSCKFIEVATDEGRGYDK
jgi:hypothetical protein